MNTEPVTLTITINAPIETVWRCWTEPAYVTQWAFASDEWEAPAASNDLRVGGVLTTTMAAKDNSARFDFSGTYTAVSEHESIEYDVADGRHVAITFQTLPDGNTRITETFDPELENPVDMQRAGWQAILDNFKTCGERQQ